MKGKILIKYVLGREISVYLPYSYDKQNKVYPVVYVQDGDKFQEILRKIINEIEEEVADGSLDEHIIVGIKPFNRLDEYTPWAAKANDEKFEDFGGQGDKYLEFLKDLSNYMEKEFRASNNKNDRKIMGHSLGGLISLYSVFRNDDYGKIASICASQWYNNWIDFIKEEKIINRDFKLIIIAGKKEGHGKVTIQKDAPKFSKIAYEIFKKRIGEKRIEMVWDNYEHHENILYRYKTALEFLLEK